MIVLPELKKYKLWMVELALCAGTGHPLLVLPYRHDSAGLARIGCSHLYQFQVRYGLLEPNLSISRRLLEYIYILILIPDIFSLPFITSFCHHLNHRWHPERLIN